MKRILFLFLAGCACCLQAASPAGRSVKICVASSAPPEIRRAAQEVLAAVGKQTLLSVMAGTHPPAVLTDSATLAAARAEDQAYDHLVLIGLADDPLIAIAWQREAKMEPGGLYLFGFGYFVGDIGYVESDRNPFLHGRAIKTAPYETETVTLTGTSPHGVALAVEAFLKQGLINGVIAAPGWKRSRPSLLERDPLAPGFALPDVAPKEAGDMSLIGFTQAGEDEYRGVLADTGVAPRWIGRMKYCQPGSWDGPGAGNAVEEYIRGLHKRAFGDTLWCARFASEAEAAAAAARIAAAAHLQGSGNLWKGLQPAHARGLDSPGPLTLSRRREWVLLSTLPEKNAAALTR